MTAPFDDREAAENQTLRYIPQWTGWQRAHFETTPFDAPADAKFFREAGQGMHGRRPEAELHARETGFEVEGHTRGPDAVLGALGNSGKRGEGAFD